MTQAAAQQFSAEKLRKILLVFAHPDDELICGWPILQDASVEKEVLICSSDAFNPARKWCRHRKQSLFALCESLGIACRCLDYPSEFYRTPHRQPRRRGGIRRLVPQKTFPYLLRDVAKTILEAIAENPCDAVFTHNAWGEYGHLDHIFLHRLVFDNCTHPVITTDMRLDVDWLPLAGDAPLHAPLLAPHAWRTAHLDAAFYESCAAFYRKDRVWTWSSEPVAATNLYLFKPGGRSISSTE